MTDMELAVTELTALKEHPQYPPIRWQVIDIPKWNDDFNTHREWKTLRGDRSTVAFVADGVNLSEKIDGESRSTHYARIFGTRVLQSLTEGKNIQEAIDDGAEVIKDGYRTPIFRYEKLFTHLPVDFAFSTTIITPPETESGLYNLDLATYHDCFTSTISPKLVDGKVIFETKVYPYGDNSVDQSHHEVYPRSIVLVGSDGCIKRIGEYLLKVLKEKAKTLPSVETSRLFDEIDDLQRQYDSGTFESDREIAEKLISHFAMETGLSVGAEEEWVQKLSSILTPQQGERSPDDITLLAAYLPPAKREVLTNPDRSYTLDEVVTILEDNLFELKIDRPPDGHRPILDDETHKISGKILGCEFNSIGEFAYLLRDLFQSGHLPGTRIPIKPRPYEFFDKSNNPEYEGFGLFKNFLERGVLLYNDDSKPILRDIPKYLRITFIEPIRSLLYSDESLVEHQSRPTEGSLDILNDKKASKAQRAFIISSVMGNHSWTDLDPGVQKWIEMEFGKPQQTTGQLVCSPPKTTHRICHVGEEAMIPQITINRFIDTAPLDFTKAVVMKPVVGTEGGILIPGVLLRPTKETARLLSVLYLHNVSEVTGALKGIKNIDVPKAIFRPDRPVQEGYEQEFMQ